MTYSKVFDGFFRDQFAKGKNDHNDGGDHHEKNEENVLNAELDAIVEEIQNADQSQNQPKRNHFVNDKYLLRISLGFFSSRKDFYCLIVVFFFFGIKSAHKAIDCWFFVSKQKSAHEATRTMQ